MTNRIGPYRVIRLINRGGQGGVYLGYDSRLQRPVAIKLYRLPESRVERKRLLLEAQLVASIQSPKVVQIFDLVAGRDNIALIMEYVPGCDLEEFLAEVRPSVASVLTVATDLAGALAAARQQKIIHGDVKAKNVLVTVEGRVKLTDFGIARTGDQSASAVRWAGSASCISPEQYLGMPLDVRSDLFALGCLAYRMLTGRQPFFRDGRLDTESLIEKMPPAVETLAADLPQGLPELIASLLQKDPADRPADTRQLRNSLRDIARRMPLSIANSLLEESHGCFREQSPGDVPPLIPVDLQRGSRSRLHRFQFGELSSWRRLWPQNFLGRASLLLIFCAPVALFFRGPFVSSETRIHIERPVLQVAADIDLPGSVSSSWLVEQVKHAARSQLGAIVVTGPVGATPNRVLYASPREMAPQEQLSLALRCSGDWCLFALSREREGGRENRQAILVPDMPLAQWQHTIQGVTRALYDQ